MQNLSTIQKHLFHHYSITRVSKGAMDMREMTEKPQIRLKYLSSKWLKMQNYAALFKSLLVIFEGSFSEHERFIINVAKQRDAELCFPKFDQLKCVDASCPGCLLLKMCENNVVFVSIACFQSAFLGFTSSSLPVSFVCLSCGGTSGHTTPQKRSILFPETLHPGLDIWLSYSCWNCGSGWPNRVAACCLT